MADEDYYSLLGLDPHAPEREIKKAYHNLARSLHPDKARDAEESRRNAEKLAHISKAYNTLKDPEKRKQYDMKRGNAPAVAPANGQAQSAPQPAEQAPAGSGAAPRTRSAVRPNRQQNTPQVSNSDLQAQRVVTAQKAFVKGMDFFKNQDFKKALPFFEAAVQNDPESEPHYHMKLAICLLRTKGSFTKAVAAAEKACDMDTYNVEFKFSLGEIYETVGVTSKAINVYADILNWEPDNQKAKMKLDLMKKVENPTAGDSFLQKLFPSLFKK